MAVWFTQNWLNSASFARLIAHLVVERVDLPPPDAEKVRYLGRSPPGYTLLTAFRKFVDGSMTFAAWREFVRAHRLKREVEFERHVAEKAGDTDKVTGLATLSVAAISLGNYAKEFPDASAVFPYGGYYSGWQTVGKTATWIRFLRFAPDEALISVDEAYLRELEAHYRYIDHGGQEQNHPLERAFVTAWLIGEYAFAKSLLDPV